MGTVFQEFASRRAARLAAEGTAREESSWYDDLVRESVEGYELRRIDLSGLSITECSFKNANLEAASFHKTRVVSSAFEGANVSNAALTKSEFLDCDFSRADLSHADLFKCSFDDCNLSVTNLTGARLERTSILRSRLADIRGLEAAQIVSILVRTDGQLSLLTGTEARAWLASQAV